MLFPSPDGIREGIQGYVPTPEAAAAKEAFRDDKFGVFIHWGVYAMLGHNEWVLYNEKLPNKEYVKLPGGFFPSKFNAREYFANFFGIFVGGEYKPELIRLKVDAYQVNYFNSLPLHPSQKLVKTHEGYSIYEYWLAPTLDFKQEILRHGPTVEVLSPESLREEVKEDIAAMVSMYGV